MTKVGMISLGCAKNQVDAEVLLALAKREGFEISGNIEECDAVIVNTCGFIEDAKRESIEAILECCESKGRGRLKCVAVTGCLAERYREELAAEIPEADVILGIGANLTLGEAISSALKGKRVVRFADKELLPMNGERLLTTPPYYAYIKVAEGCDNRCSYCSIPLIRGGFRSRKFEDIVEEARALAKKGAVEINLIAQDTTRYGEDLYGESRLPELIEAVAEIEEVKWVRILYCYPDRVSDRLLDTMARTPKAVRYLDIPIQHVSGKVLKDMNRRGDAGSLLELFSKVREKLPGAVIRTTLLAGYPTESEEDFTELCRFVQEAKCERLGCFAYSQEEGTPAGELEQLDIEIRRRRADIIMELQAGVAFDFAASCIGRTLEVLVEGEEDGLYFGRSYMDAPDVDTKVYFSSEKRLTAGEIIDVMITDSEGYDLLGKAL